MSIADEQTPDPLRPIRAVTNTHRELPPVHMGHSDKFFDHLVESSQGGKVLPTWKGSSILILNQFPDVLPGSAIGMVYDTTPRSCTPRWGGGPGDARARCQPRRAQAPPADAARICEGVGRRAGSAGCVGKGRGGVWAEQDQCYACTVDPA
ncbi:hypothetical protein B0H14DRAFT_2569357 [Mycena olivaceomarginata]|nr:hypothetical protein B0H14DRAFT_2569357 [Mycena olivaceomarginata]